MRGLAAFVAAAALMGAGSPVGAEFCDPYIDRQNQLQEGFRCPVKEVIPRYGFMYGYVRILGFDSFKDICTKSVDLLDHLCSAII